MSFLEPVTQIGNSLTAEAHSEPHQTSKIVFFCKKCFQPLTVVAKSSLHVVDKKSL